MPYNNTPIAPAKEVTGTVSLPLARIKKIINVDDDIGNCSNNAAFVITVATEMFLQHLVEQSYNIVKSERKPRRNIQYRDVANAVARVENLEFLSDVVPKTQTYRQFKQKQAGAQPNTTTTEATANGADVAMGVPQANGLEAGQRTLNMHMGAPRVGVGDVGQQASNGAKDEVEAMDVDEDSSVFARRGKGDLRVETTAIEQT